MNGNEVRELWQFLPKGYLLSIAIEAPILLVGLSARHSMKVRLFAGLWLTACTYPIVVLVMPLAIGQMMSASVSEGVARAIYLTVAETFAPAAECALFWAAFGGRAEWGTRSMWRDFIAIIVANLASFGAGELLGWLRWWPFGEPNR
jgi:hypothetical protein